jgi:hypothetical protein
VNDEYWRRYSRTIYITYGSDVWELCHVLDLHRTFPNNFIYLLLNLAVFIGVLHELILSRVYIR